jgi:two-component system sensor histidine kinase AlgZ
MAAKHNKSPATTPSSRAWLPDFCAFRVVLTHLFIGALVGMVIGLSPPAAPISLNELSVSVLLAMWASLCAGMALCPLRRLLASMPPWAAIATTYVVVGAAVGAVALIAAWIDDALKVTGATHASLFGFAFRCILLAALTWTVLLRYYFVREQWQRGVAAQARAQFEALQARIRPHFLFNSMNTIATLIRRRPDSAEQAIEDLSDLFRAALGEPRTMTTLADEIALVRRYLDIEKLRLAERLAVDIRLPDALRAVPVPALLLQPLVENAVYHGIETMAEGGTITVDIAAADEMVTIDITNPFDPDAPRRRRGAGMALDNIRQRIALLYADIASIEVSATPSTHRVRLTLPRRAEQAAG